MFAGERERTGEGLAGVLALLFRGANSASLLYIGEYFFESPQTLGVGD